MKPKQNLMQTCLLGAMLLSALTALATTRVVTSLNDSGPGTLRDTIGASAANDRIDFTANGTITLTSGELLLGRNLTITGPGATNLTINGNNSGRVFEIATNVVVNISGCAISDGLVVGINGTNGGYPNGPSPGGPSLGGGILNSGTLTLSNCFLLNNLAEGGMGGLGTSWTGANGGDSSGGGIFNYGTLTLTGCTFSKNAATGGNAGYDESGPNSPATGGAGIGAGIASQGVLALTNCTFFANYAEGGTVAESNYQVSGGSGLGGAIWSGGTSLVMVNCTVSGNGATGGNGLQNVQYEDLGGNGSGGGLSVTLGSLTLWNTLVAANTVSAGQGEVVDSQGGNGAVSAPDVAASVTSLGHNLIGETEGSSGWNASDLTGTSAAPLNPQLGSLQNNGGPTPTLALLPTSPAIDAGDDAVLSPPYNLSMDQRGIHRPAGSHVDIGAYEFGGTELVTTLADSGLGSLRQAIASASDGDRIIFTPLITGTIILTNGELLISEQLNIIGPGATNLTISGNQSSRVFHVSPSGGLNLVGVTLANGFVAGAEGATGLPGEDAFGGGLLDEGSASLTDCVITNCMTTGGRGSVGASDSQGMNGGDGAGGGIQNDGLLSLLRCTLSGNSVQGGQGGTGGKSLNDGITGGNGGDALGAGFSNTGIVTLTNCTLTGNTATGGLGGTGNHPITGGAGQGGLGGSAEGAGLNLAAGNASLCSCTCSGNRSVAGNGGAGGGAHGSGGSLGPGLAYGGGLFSGGSVYLQNCIMAANQADMAPDVNGIIQSGGFNLVGISDGSTGWLVAEAGNLGNSSFPINPMLGPLQNNGGATPTMALLMGSAAIDQGNSFGLTTDQRGFPRPSDNGSIANASGGDGSDIGAYEVIVTTPALLTLVGFANSHFQLLLTGQAGSSYAIQASTNLSATNWISIFTNTSPFTFVDSNANTFPHRFYRGVSSP